MSGVEARSDVSNSISIRQASVGIATTFSARESRMQDPDFLLYGGLGGLVVEIIMINEYRMKLRKKKFRKIFTARSYWACVSGMVIMSAIVAWVLYAGTDIGDQAKVRTVFIAGIAAESIVRSFLRGSPRKRAHFGGETSEEEQITLSDVLNL